MRVSISGLTDGRVIAVVVDDRGERGAVAEVEEVVVLDREVVGLGVLAEPVLRVLAAGEGFEVERGLGVVDEDRVVDLAAGVVAELERGGVALLAELRDVGVSAGPDAGDVGVDRERERRGILAAEAGDAAVVLEAAAGVGAGVVEREAELEPAPEAAVGVERVVAREGADEVLRAHGPAEELEVVVGVGEDLDVVDDRPAPDGAEGDAVDLAVGLEPEAGVADGDVAEDARAVVVVTLEARRSVAPEAGVVGGRDAFDVVDARRAVRRGAAEEDEAAPERAVELVEVRGMVTSSASAVMMMGASARPSAMRSALTITTRPEARSPVAGEGTARPLMMVPGWMMSVAFGRT